MVHPCSQNLAEQSLERMEGAAEEAGKDSTWLAASKDVSPGPDLLKKRRTFDPTVSPLLGIFYHEVVWEHLIREEASRNTFNRNLNNRSPRPSTLKRQVECQEAPGLRNPPNIFGGCT